MLLSLTTLLSLSVSGAVIQAPLPGYRLEILSTANPGGSMAIGVNSGVVAGACRPFPGTMEPCIWIDGVRTELGIPPGASQGVAQAANASGVVVGFGTSGWATGVAFRYAGGLMSLLPPVAGSAAWAVEINDLGQVVGATSIVAGGAADVAVFWDAAGTPKPLGTLGGVRSLAFGLNELGEVAGWSNVASGERRPFLWTGGQLTELPLVPGDTIGWATDLNDRGLVVGGSMRRAVMWEAGQVRHLPTPDWAFFSEAAGVNASGQIVGGVTYGGQNIPVLWNGNEPLPFANLAPAPDDWQYTLAQDIDDAGCIVGTGGLGGVGRGFLLTPLAANLNRDAWLDRGDAALFALAYVRSDELADVTGDGAVDRDDLRAFARAFSGRR